MLWGGPFYGIGPKVYQAPGSMGSAPAPAVQGETLKRLPNVSPEGLRGGGILRWAVDDSRLPINLCRHRGGAGGEFFNYAPVTAILRDADGLVEGVTAWDSETGREFTARAKVVINARRDPSPTRSGAWPTPA